ncbi:xanthine dehydrogenase subunit D [Paenibacillus sp. 598K]|uniref:xanthine dehydrogenase subunit D n=1 Tax=Paenibacillus sp. 598K TaxID=1117987 RepID=UPI000FFAD4F7|nr:xanthine dehydrogenase subunit D [Paenibacillus sp. 598K]GBF72215.1 xanthine dehydrogenase subunit D [Paenibacillus sp. 598K]
MRLDRQTAQGRWHRRPDGKAKTTGELAYLTDLTAPGMLYGKVLRSAYPHARLLAIRTERAERLPGVHAVLTHRDVPGLNRFGIVQPDQPVLCEDRVRYIGDAIAAVAAESPELAAYALALIEVEYEPLPVLDSPKAALAEDAPLLHPEGNVLHRTSYARGDTTAAFARCVHIVEQTYQTPRQMHGYMETEGGLFSYEADGRLVVRAATQHGYKDRMQLARILAMPEEQIRVVSSPIGGSFGGKDELNVQPYGALLTIRTGRPVKLHNSRRESVTAGLKRHPMRVRMKTGIDAEGRLLAHEVEIVADTGAYATLGAPVLNFATEHAMGPYRIPHVCVQGRSVYTNNGVSGEFRGFGGNQVIFALEGQMDRLAAIAGIEPWELRRRNLRAAADPGPMGQTIAPTDGALQVWRSAARSRLEARSSVSATQADDPPWLRRGIGSAIAMHGSGLGYGIPDPGGGRLSLTSEGKLEAAFSFEEFGQGIVATLEIMMLELFGCAAGDLSIVLGDTDKTPHSGSSTASRSTTIAYLTLRELQPRLTEAMLAAAAASSGAAQEALTTGPGGIWLRSPGSEPRLLLSYRELAERAERPLRCEAAIHFPVTPDPVVGAHFLYTCTAVTVEVEVNTLTGAVSLRAQRHAVAAGEVVNPMGYIGQIEGGASMALGFALMEDAEMEEGRYATENLDTYLLPGVADTPASLEIDAIEELAPDDPYGPRGIGEVGSVALAPAIAAAVRDAMGPGVWIAELPIRRETLIRRFAPRAEEGMR